MNQLTNIVSAEDQKLLACIHCGLCLEACPTYVITGDENDGPRGRLYLMRAVAEGRLPETSPSFSSHIDRCLGCRACEQVCPAGVEYGQLLEASRELLTTAQPKSGAANASLNFALKHIWPYPQRLRLFFAGSRIFRNLGLARVIVKSKLLKLLSPRAEFAMALLDSSRGSRPLRSGIEKTPQAAANVMLFAGCVGEGLFARVNVATRRVLGVNNWRTEVPAGQVCCGALHAHAGDLEGARKLARQNILAFADEAGCPVVTNAGGCGAMLQSYDHLLAHDEEFVARAQIFSSRVRDVAQQLESGDIRRGSAITDEVVTYDASCHLLYGQHAADASERMMRTIPGLAFANLEGAERCCGGAGIYNLLQPELSSRVLAEKLKNVAATNAGVLATGNPGCQMQIGAGACLAGKDLKVCHPVELLDESYAKAGFYTNE